MSISNAPSPEELKSSRSLASTSFTDNRANASAVSWGAIIAGATAAASLSMIMLILGTGLGLSSVSPWVNSGISAKTFGVTTILWVTLTQLVASGMGGYLAGRLRAKWVTAHNNEIYFRDTAHGFLAWSVASLVTAALLTSVVTNIVSGGIQAGAAATGSVATTALAATAGGVAASGANDGPSAKGAEREGPMEYFVDSLFRKNAGTTTSASQPQSSTASAAEVARIFANSIQNGPLPAGDVQYAGQIVAQRTGLTQQEAEKRVLDTYTRMQTKLRDLETAARDTADKARKASAYTALWLAITLLIGAFVASLTAVYGGRQRDL